MYTELNDINIPEELGNAVQESMRRVKRLHQKKLLKRAGTACGSLVAVVAAFLIFGFTNPALASSIPLLGGLFRQANSESKMPGATNIEGYGVIQPVNQTAQTENKDCVLTVTEAYSDGTTMQVGLKLDAPENFASRYSGIDTEYGRKTSAKINGEEAEVIIVNPFYLRNGEWTSTMSLNVPQAQQNQDSLEVSVQFEGFAGRIKSIESGTLNTEALEGGFEASFPVKVDRDHQFSFDSDAEDNGAKVFSVSGTPAETRISVEKPYWGQVHETVPEDGAKGFPALLTMDGAQVQKLASKTYDGGYDYQSAEVQNADLYFDGLPAGTKQAVLRFYESNRQEEVMAEFTVDLEQKTVTPSTTYREEGPLNLNNPYRYMSLQNGEGGEEQNGYSVKHIGFYQYTGPLTGSVSFSYPAGSEGKKLRVDVVDSEKNLLFSSESVNAAGEWNDSWSINKFDDVYEEIDGVKVPSGWPSQYSVHGEIPGTKVSIGESVTIKITDLESGKVLCTDSRTLDNVQN